MISDDQGYDDFGFMGSERIETPHLDRLAAEGTVFTHGYVSASICDPSLRSIATGLHPLQSEMRIARLAEQGTRRGNARDMIDFVTLPRLLAEVGYRSFQAGKFFGGSYDLAGFSEGMNEPGADLRFGGPARKTLGRTTMQPVIDFLDSVSQSGKSKSNSPFFLWFAPMLPHRPFDAEPEFQQLYSGEEFDDLNNGTRRYYANITRLDARIGELIAALEARGLREDTLIVFLSDNGWDHGPGQRIGNGWDADGEKGKRSMYELGFRTPILFNWPGRIAAGVRRDELVSSVDLFPTLLDFAGAPPRNDRPGFDLRSLIEGTEQPPRDAVFASMGDVRASDLRPRPADGPKLDPGVMLRTPEWAWIGYPRGGFEELYDMRADPKQTRNLARERPKIAAKLRRRMEEWKQRMIRVYSKSAVAPPAS
jgi:uncharacterized sulfatase